MTFSFLILQLNNYVSDNNPKHVAQLKKLGFGKFVGVDGSKAMLELARQSGLYQDSKQIMLGEEPLPIQWGI